MPPGINYSQAKRVIDAQRTAILRHFKSVPLDNLPPYIGEYTGAVVYRHVGGILCRSLAYDFEDSRPMNGGGKGIRKETCSVFMHFLVPRCTDEQLISARYMIALTRGPHIIDDHSVGGDYLIKEAIEVTRPNGILQVTTNKSGTALLGGQTLLGTNTA